MFQPVRPFYGQGGHVVFPAPSGLNGQTKRSERRPAGRARRAPAPGAGPQWAPRVPWGAQPKKQGMRISLQQRSCCAHFHRKANRVTAQLVACDAAARSATATPRLPGRPPPRPVAVHHEMDDGDLPPVPLLPLSRPAAQALNDNPDAPLSPESTGGDGSLPTNQDPRRTRRRRNARARRYRAKLRSPL